MKRKYREVQRKDKGNATENPKKRKKDGGKGA